MKDIKSSKHLTNIILNRNKGIPNFAFLLGAGASSNSGIGTAEDMIMDWQRQLYGQTSTTENFDNWLKSQKWYQKDDAYSFLFGTLYDEPSQRRDYIEECMEGSHPGWGYVYLAGLLEAQIINTTFTTNFDDLINEACYLYTNKVRPIVCAHDSQVSNLRITGKRTKIIKLHGDFLFNNIKNIKRETFSLEGNMEDKFRQFGQEYGLVVIGYGGRDESVMSIIEELVQKEDCFKHGVYWCILENETPVKRVQELIKYDGVHAVEIDGFDEFMALLSKQAKLELPAMLVNPSLIAEQRSKVFCSVPERLRSNSIISDDIDKLMKGLKTTLKSPRKEQVDLLEHIPYSIRATFLEDQGDINGAIESMRLAVAEDPEDRFCSHAYADMLAKYDKTEALRNFIDTSCIHDEDKVYFRLFLHNDEELIEYANNKLLGDPNNLYYRINKAISLKRLAKMDEMNKELDILENLNPPDHIMAGMEALRGEKFKMFKLLDIALTRKLLSLENITNLPVFEDYLKDDDFISFLKKKEGNKEK